MGFENRRAKREIAKKYHVPLEDIQKRLKREWQEDVTTIMAGEWGQKMKKPAHLKIDQLKALYTAAKKGRLSEVQTLLNNGVPVDCTPFGSITPCFIAASTGQVECMKCLIEGQ